MRINTKIRYGIRMLILLAESQNVVNTAELGAKMHVSPKYLRKLAGPLEKAKLIKSIQGIHGGYMLNKAASAISFTNVFEAFNEKIKLTDCLKLGKCTLFDDCLVRPFWEYLENKIEKEFFDISIADIKNGKFKNQ